MQSLVRSTATEEVETEAVLEADAKNFWDHCSLTSHRKDDGLAIKTSPKQKPL